VTVLSMLLLGLFIGMRHALDADHLAAVATLATRQSSLGRAVALGAAWGLGHTITLGLVGGLVLALGTTIPEGLASTLELGVGLMLVLLGADVLLRLARSRIHWHAHRHDGAFHFHAHAHVDGPAHDGHGHPAREWPTRALCVGMVHGMAGSAALVLLALERAPSVAQGLLFVAAFGIGSIAGMAALSTVIAVPLRATLRHAGFAYQGLTAVVGLATCGLGLHIVGASLA
jgi:hypothetical protein